MRADRLLSILMLLQARGRMSAPALARELEVCERTIYRDVDALSAAGVPIYGEPGRGGGYSLLDSYRTTLTGLTEGEARALFMFGIPRLLADGSTELAEILGLGQELRAALRKLSAALPGSRREDEQRVRQRFLLDMVSEEQVETSAPHLATVYRAVWEDRKLYLAYRVGPLAVQIEQTVDPYGIVAKAGDWHLVYASKGALRVLRVAALLDARLGDETFARPAGFDLATFWREWLAARDVSRARYVVTLRAAPDLVAELPGHFGDAAREQIARAGPPDAGGWLTLQLSFESLEAARARLLGFGAAVEVLAPYALRRSIQDYAEQIAAVYAPGKV